MKVSKPDTLLNELEERDQSGCQPDAYHGTHWLDDRENVFRGCLSLLFSRVGNIINPRLELT
jgi:hypothetical protein